MANNYNSSYYANAPFRGTATPIARYPNVDHVAQDVQDIVTVPVTASLGANDTFTVTPVLPAGCRITRFSIIPSVALDSGTNLTIDVGWTSSTATLISNTSWGRNTTAVSATDTQILAAAASAAGDNLLVTVHTAPQTPVAAGGTVTILFDIIYP